jgi:hypothetical protein
MNQQIKIHAQNSRKSTNFTRITITLLEHLTSFDLKYLRDFFLAFELIIFFSLPLRMPTRRQTSCQQGVIKLEGVPTQLALSTLVRRLTISTKSLTGIFRVSNYNLGIKTDTVFLYLHDKDEVEALLRAEHFSSDGKFIPVMNPNVTPIIGQLPNVDPAERRRLLDMLPFAVGIAQLNVGRDSIASLNLGNVLKVLEDIGNVTGFKFAIGDKPSKIRKFGIALFLTNAEANKLRESRELQFNGEQFVTNSATSFPILIDTSHQIQLDRNRAPITLELIGLNQLADQTPPFARTIENETERPLTPRIEEMMELGGYDELFAEIIPMLDDVRVEHESPATSSTVHATMSEHRESGTKKKPHTTQQAQEAGEVKVEPMDEDVSDDSVSEVDYKRRKTN